MIVPPLHVVATDAVARRHGFRHLAGEMLETAGPALALHLRLRDTDGRELYGLASHLAGIASDCGGWCVVNGRADVGLTSGAQAVQLGHGALPVPAVRAILSGRAAIGSSVHSADEALRRAAEGADYLLAGTVFRSATHPDREPAGLGLVRECAGAGIPVVGIGGIDERSAARVMEAGATGVAVVRAIWDRSDPVRAALGLARLLTEADRASDTDRHTLLEGRKGEC